MVEFTQPGLGRLLQLGGLFNGQHNEILVGQSLWSSETVARYKFVSPSRTTDIHFWEAPYQFDRMKVIKLDATMQVDILSK